MKQYDKSGPVPEPKSKLDTKIETLVSELTRRVESQDLLIKSLERDLRKLRNDMRMAIATFNTINANRQRNG